MLCNSCDKRDLCQSLCPEAEAYVNQDYVAQHDRVGVSQKAKAMPEFREGKPLLTRTQQQIAHMLLRGYSRDKIVEVLGITPKTLRNHLWELRKHVPEINPG